MSYYDDWVEPNAFFRGGAALERRAARRREHEQRVQQEAREERERRKRQCPYCEKSVIGLRDHILHKHGLSMQQVAVEKLGAITIKFNYYPGAHWDCELVAMSGVTATSEPHRSVDAALIEAVALLKEALKR